ncbi:MAG TPA: glycosyltransferase, partial [Polyangiaceae bacterium]|nr:glycosyltransferase [Polyangiaceae bacterium]
MHALAALQRYLSPHRGRVGQARDNLPRALSVPLRRALAPLRITPLSFDADVPLDAHFEPSATQRLRRSVSILVPVYGNPALTLRCLRSVVAHTPSEAEIVVVDDASPDDTYEKLAPFASAHGVILERSDRNVGFPATVNTAARQARGELLLILNSDVVVTPGWLTGLCDALDR